MTGRWLTSLFTAEPPSADRGGYGTRLFPLQVVGMLSSVVFALNFCLEIFALYAIGKNHQLLILVLQLGLSGWALAEVALLSKHEVKLPLGRLQALLLFQLLLEASRMALLLSGPQFGVGRSYGVHVMDLRQLGFLLPVYVLMFFAISKSLLAIHVHELEVAHGKLTQVAVAESRQQEREQLLRDVHDGFGSQLASVRMMVEKGRISPDQLPEYLSEVSTDLRLIVDTLSPSRVTLEEAIHNFRYRTERRFSGSGIEFHWTIELAELPSISSRVILQILRIVQEAIHNAIRHAEAHHIHFTARYRPTEGQLQVSIRDDGVGLPEQMPVGRGMGNMRHRAREIGALFSMEAAHPGALIDLRLDHLGEASPAVLKPDASTKPLA